MPVFSWLHDDDLASSSRAVGSSLALDYGGSMQRIQKELEMREKDRLAMHPSYFISRLDLLFKSSDKVKNELSYIYDDHDDEDDGDYPPLTKEQLLSRNEYLAGNSQ